MDPLTPMVILCVVCEIERASKYGTSLHMLSSRCWAATVCFVWQEKGFLQLLKFCGALHNIACFPKALPLVVVSSFPKALPLGYGMLGLQPVDYGGMVIVQDKVDITIN
jgi:hypothetical protein